MITEKTEYQLEVTDSDFINVRRSDVILKDGVEVSRTYHRHVLTPIDDISKEPDKVKNIAGLIYTADVKKAYKEKRVAEIEAYYADIESQIKASKQTDILKSAQLEKMSADKKAEIDYINSK